MGTDFAICKEGGRSVIEFVDLGGITQHIDPQDIGQQFFYVDCITVLRLLPDKCIDVAIVDPPYGINAPNMAMGTNKSRTKDGYPAESTADRLRKGRLNQGAGKLKDRALLNMDREWDFSPPDKEYFDELFRVSKNQIIWGGNYFELPPTRGIIVWDKMQPWENFSQVELAWTSYDKPAGIFRYSNTGGANKEKKIHPTQKPIALYDYLIAKCQIPPGASVIDTHVGSASSLISFYRTGIKYIGCEKTEVYYQSAKERLESEKSQLTIFDLGMERPR